LTRKSKQLRDKAKTYMSMKEKIITEVVLKWSYKYHSSN